MLCWLHARHPQHNYLLHQAVDVFRGKVNWMSLTLFVTSLQCRGDMPVAVDQVVADEEGKQFAGMRRVEVNHKLFKLRHKKPEPKE